MKALSIKQPWLWAITDLDKRIENRTWNPPLKIIGQHIALHASKKDDPEGGRAMVYLARRLPPADAPRGAIVATAKVVAVATRDNETIAADNQYYNDKWFVGPIGWILEDVQKLEEPIRTGDSRHL